jgi:UDP-glucose 4-epimerase
MIHIVESVTGCPIPYTIVPRRSGDIATCYALPEKASTLLGWKAKTSISDSIRNGWRFINAGK